MFKIFIIFLFISTSLNSQEIWYDKHGNGPPLFLIHGGPILNHRYFTPFLDSLENHFSIYFIDLPGRGESNINDTISMGIKKDAYAIEKLRKKLNLDKINLLGHSFGGYVSLAYLNLHPERVGKMVIVSSPVGITQSIFDSVKTKLKPLFKNVNNKKENIKIIEKINFAKKHSREYLKTWLDMMNEIEHKSYKNKSIRYSNNLKKDWFEIFGTMTLSFKNCSEISQGKELLFIFGKKDLLAFEKYSKRFCDECDNIKIIIFDNSAHIPFVDENEKFIKETTNFILK